MKIPNFKNGVIRESSSRSIGAGTCIGNLHRDAIREGGTSTGTGRVVGNTKDGVIYESSISSPGSGAVIGNVKDGWVYKSSTRGPGTGKKSEGLKTSLFSAWNAKRMRTSSLPGIFLLKRSSDYGSQRNHHF